MPLNAQALSQLIVTNLGQLGSDDDATNQQYNEGVKKIADAVAKAVVTHITSSAQVTIPTGAVVVATAGSPAAQTGANTAPALGTIL